MNTIKYLLYLLLFVLLLDALFAVYIHVAWTRSESQVERDANGVRLGCAAVSAGEGTTAILLVHGFADSPALYQDFIPRLTDAGFHSRAIRLKGFAGPASESNDANLATWRNQVQVAIRGLQGDYDTVWVAAHSLGGAVTLSALTDGSDPVDGLILIAPLLDVSAKRSPVLSPRAWFKVFNPLTVFTSRIQSLFPVDAQDPEVRDHHPRETFIPLSIIGALFEARDAAWASQTVSFPPVLLLQAGQDQIVNNASAQTFLDQINSPRKESLVFSKSGHIIPRDVQWEDALAAVLNFIDGTR